MYKQAWVGVSLVVTTAIVLWHCGQKEEVIDKLDKTTFLEQSNDSTITFEWDPPDSNAGEVVSYELLYRIEGDSSWQVVKSDIPVGDSPHVAVDRSDIKSNASLFYFAVRSVSAGGIKSDLHTSQDNTSENAGGWRLMWDVR
ncbi:MAG: hypothetical protein GF398_04145 [Chitinivibrionales bacterium]|nr:hypothetical protein [Chitinivibrionales bacterium]